MCRDGGWGCVDACGCGVCVVYCVVVVVVVVQESELCVCSFSTEIGNLMDGHKLLDKLLTSVQKDSMRAVLMCFFLFRNK